MYKFYLETPSRHNIDLIFMLDATTSFCDDTTTFPSSENFEKSKLFMQEFIINWIPELSDNSDRASVVNFRFCFRIKSNKKEKVTLKNVTFKVSYGNWQNVHLLLKETVNNEKVLQRITSIQPTCKKYNDIFFTERAMKFVHSHVTTQLEGDRFDAINVVIMIMQWSGK